MKLFFAVISCESYLPVQRGIRETWGKDLPTGCDLRFFVGHGTSSLPSDTIRLSVGDDYDSITNKVCKAVSWVLSNTDADHAFICYCDTWCNVPGLLTCGYERYDFSGSIVLCPFCWGTSAHNWVMGGNGYFLSRRAMEVIAQGVPITHLTSQDDFNLGAVLEPRFGLHHIDMLLCGLSRHLHGSAGARIFNPDLMLEAHRLGAEGWKTEVQGIVFLFSQFGEWQRILDAHKRGEFEARNNLVRLVTDRLPDRGPFVARMLTSKQFWESWLGERFD